LSKIGRHLQQFTATESGHSKWQDASTTKVCTIRYDTIEEIDVDSKAEYTA